MIGLPFKLILFWGCIKTIMTWCRRGKSEKVQKGLVFPKHGLGIQKFRTQMKKFHQIDSLEVPETYYQNVHFLHV